MITDFIMLTAKDKHNKHKCIVKIEDIILIGVQQNNGGGQYCCDVFLKRIKNPMKVEETPDEIWAKIEEAETK